MLKIFLASFAMLISSLASIGQTNRTSTLVFEPDVYDFGRIEEADGKVGYTFTGTNRGRTPLVLEAVTTSCGCTTPSFSRAPILPGKQVEIRVEFDPTDRPGKFSKTITVTSDGGRNRNLLRITGDVILRPRAIGEAFPFDLGNGLVVNTVQLGFRFVDQNSTKSQVLRILNTTGREISIDTAMGASTGLIDLSYPPTICKGCKAEMTVTYDLMRDKRYGMLSDQIFLVVDGKRSNTPIHATAIGIDDFSQSDPEKAPALEIDRQYHDFGTVSSEKPLETEFTLTNRGKGTLVFRYVGVSPGASCTLEPGTKLWPGESLTVRLAVKTEMSEKDTIFGRITMVVNEPGQPLRGIRYTAVVTD